MSPAISLVLVVLMALLLALGQWMLTTLAAVEGTKPAKWEMVLPQHQNRDYIGTRPRMRYSHTATVVGEEVIIVFGYFYDFYDRGVPTWHSDVWAANTTLAARSPISSGPWRQITAGGHEGDPAPRMNHMAVALPGSEGKLLIFGGSDKRHTKLNDIWEFNVPIGLWTQRVATNAPPSARDCATLVAAGSALLLYGGFHLGDLWRYDLETNRWELLMDAPKKDHAGHPGKRAAHSAVISPDGKDMYVYGGFRFENDVSHKSLGWGKLEDLWLYGTAMNVWSRMPQADGTQGGRQFMSMELVPWWGNVAADTKLAGHGLAVFAGTQCNPNCNLVSGLSVYSLEDGSWYAVNMEEELLGRYHGVMALCGGALWIHGGESFDPHMYHNSLSRLAWPPPLQAVVKAEGTQSSREAEM